MESSPDKALSLSLVWDDPPVRLLRTVGLIPREGLRVGRRALFFTLLATVTRRVECPNWRGSSRARQGYRASIPLRSTKLVFRGNEGGQSCGCIRRKLDVVAHRLRERAVDGRSTAVVVPMNRRGRRRLPAWAAAWALP